MSTRALSLPTIDLVRTPHSTRTLAILLAISFVALPVLLVFAPWQQSISGSGYVSALTPVERQQTVDTPVDGRIVNWYVIEGSTVKKGDPIVEIADIDPTLPMRLRNERDAALERINATQLREQQIGERILELEGSLKNELAAADFRIQQADDRVRAAEQALEAAEASELVARQNVERRRLLFPKGIASQRDLELSEAEFARAVADLARAKATLSESRNFKRTAEAERARAVNAGTALIKDARASREAARGEIASARQALQPIEVRLNRQATQTVTAPGDGTIFRLLAQPGSAVLKAGDAVASFVPAASKAVVELWVSGNDMPLIRPGRQVRMQFEGWPAIQFVGWPSVAVGTFGGRVFLVDATESGNGKFRILVEPDPNDEPWPSQTYLRQGVRTKGWVLINMVPLGFELWRQFNGFPPTAPEGAEGGKEKKDEAKDKK